MRLSNFLYFSQNAKLTMKYLFFLLFLSLNTLYSQEKYPQNYFRNPLDIPMQLSGNFGELRPNHFHAGFDFKTNQREGLNIYAAADGYVSRIKISLVGYGKAIYISHPNGYTTVYGHLQKAVGKIQDKIVDEQYMQSSYEIELFLKPDELPVKQGEVIGISGNTGGSDGPHLHYEIRDSKTEKVLNPLLFGYDIKDSKKPIVSSLFAYPLDKNAIINQSKRPVALNLSLQSDGTYLSEKVLATGAIGFGIASYDTDDVSYNANGIYKAQLFSNGKPVFGYEFDAMYFDEARYINAFIDYGRYKRSKQRVQKLFKTNNEKWANITDNIDSGIFNINQNFSEIKKIQVSDFKGNTTIINLPIEFSSKPSTINSDEKITKYFIKAKTDALFENDNITVYFPANTFYEDFYLDFNTQKNTLFLHEDTIPVNSSFTITFTDATITSQDKKKTFIAYVNSNGKLSYYNTKIEENTFSCKSKTLGKYILAKDTLAPKISIAKSIENKDLSKQKSISLTISDDLSGVNTYNGYINDNWVLFEYEPKTKKITHTFIDTLLTEGANKLKVIVTDNVGNSTTFETQFNRYQKK